MRSINQSKLAFYTSIMATVLAVLVLTATGRATVSIDPGESVVLQPEACADRSGFRAPGVQDYSDCAVNCIATCDLSQNAALASFNLNKTAGDLFVVSTIYGQFTVTDSNNTQSQLDVTIDYDVAWRGLWTLGGLFTGYNDCKAEVTVYLYDVTNGSKVVKKTEPPIHSMTPDGFVGIDILDLGAAQDIGNTANSMSARVTRGHTYRVALTLDIRGRGLANADVILDYHALGYGLFWNNFEVAVAPDLAEKVAELDARVTVLEEEVVSLRNDLESHTHTYMTGRGTGHNNTEAQTSAAIIMGDDNLPDSLLAWLAEDEVKSRSLATKSVLLNNYPNPFNATTTIQYAIPEPAQVTIAIYNTLGQKVETLRSEYQSAGEYSVEMDASHLSSGVYFYRLTTGRYAETRKLILLK